MKAVILTLAVFLTAMISCKKSKTYCGVKEPLQDINWLKSVTSSNPQNVHIYKQTYRSIEGFYFYVCANADCSIYGGDYYKTCDDSVIYSSNSSGAGPAFPNDFDNATTYKELIYPQ